MGVAQVTINVSVRQAIGPEDAARRNTDELRDGFLVQDLFRPGEIDLLYSHLDRMIIGSAVPIDAPLVLDAVSETGTDRFLDRRELVVLNIGPPGHVETGSERYPLGRLEALYVGRGAGPTCLVSDDASTPAQFYLVSTPAHRTCPTVRIGFEDARKLKAGSAGEANARTINQYVHPEVCESCQVLLGVTMFEPGSIWNTMPAHVHDRRMEAYLYFGMGPETRVFHFMGEPHETRHLVIKDRQAVLSPGWSIHAGAGTGNYSFVWAMAGDNVSFTDMDQVPMDALR
jgi:4-deoxy-L-threo-5-hexosulose-uronate ketol-isomerase